MGGKTLSERSPAAVDQPTDSGSGRGSAWKTVLFNCHCHTFHEVALQLTKAIRCTYEKGLQYANVVHHTGSAIVYSGSRERCEAVAAVLEGIGLRVKVDR